MGACGFFFFFFFLGGGGGGREGDWMEKISRGWHLCNRLLRLASICSNYSKLSYTKIIMITVQLKE